MIIKPAFETLVLYSYMNGSVAAQRATKRAVQTPSFLIRVSIDSAGGSMDSG
jgi:hypothetical protein